MIQRGKIVGGGRGGEGEIHNGVGVVGVVGESGHILERNRDGGRGGGKIGGVPDVVVDVAGRRDGEIWGVGPLFRVVAACSEHVVDGTDREEEGRSQLQGRLIGDCLGGAEGGEGGERRGERGECENREREERGKRGVGGVIQVGQKTECYCQPLF